MNRLNIYPVAEVEPKSAHYRVLVNGRESGVYTSYRFDPGNYQKRIAGRPVSDVSFTAFDFEGEVTIEIYLETEPTEQVAVRPLKLGINPITDGKKISFKIDKPANFSVEPYGTFCPLHIFANPMESEVPDKNDPKVHYFPAGVHEIDPIRLKDGETVYLEGGAFVYAKPQPPEKTEPFGLVNAFDMKWIECMLNAEKVKNVRVCGRGVLCGRKTLDNLQRHRLLVISESTDVSAEGIIFREGTSWSVQTHRAENVHIDNVKVLGHFCNNDGIDICDSADVLVENSFAHNADDSFLVKGFEPVKNVVFSNCTAWNDVSTSFGAVCEMAADTENVVFKDCTVTHSTFHLWDHDSGGVIGIWNAYGGNVENFLFENIVLEDCCADKEPIKVSVTWRDEGRISNVHFKNIQVLKSEDERIAVYGDVPQAADNITLENIIINGKKVESINDKRIVNRCNAEIKIK